MGMSAENLGRRPFVVRNKDAGRAPGIKGKLNSIFRRGGKDVPHEDPSSSDVFAVGADNGRSWTLNRAPRTEQESPEHIRPIEPRDVNTMVEEGWFEDPETLLALKGDVVNNSTVPAVWTPETRAKFRDEVLMPFYFPDGPITVVANDERGRHIRTTEVTRQSWVLEWKNKDGETKIKAARSLIDKDAWASDPDWQKYKAGHFQMLVVAPDSRDHGFGLKIADETHKIAFEEQEFDRVITWVNMNTIRHSITERFFKSLGYREDRRITGLREITLANGEKVETRGYMLTPNKRRDNLASDQDPRLRWEKKKNEYQKKEAGNR